MVEKFAQAMRLADEERNGTRVARARDADNSAGDVPSYRHDGSCVSSR